MSTEVLRHEDLLRWRLPSFQRKIDASRRVIDEALAVMRCPYVAFSGGKDSLVTLDLVRRANPTIPALWADDELECPETVTFNSAPERRVGIVSGFARHAGWFDPWRTPPPFRPALPGMIWTGMRMEPWSWASGYDGCFVGLRKIEATHRRIVLSKKGLLYQVADGQWRCHPLAHWTVDEVWAYLAGREIAYNPVYDVLSRIGVPRAEQRVGPLPLAHGWHLRMGWPELYRQLVERYGQVWGGS